MPAKNVFYAKHCTFWATNGDCLVQCYCMCLVKLKVFIKTYLFIIINKFYCTSQALHAFC